MSQEADLCSVEEPHSCCRPTAQKSGSSEYPMLGIGSTGLSAGYPLEVLTPCIGLHHCTDACSDGASVKPVLKDVLAPTKHRL